MIYVNCDASYHNRWAGLAYQSDRLESQTQLVECNNYEAELHALLLAMSAAEQAAQPHQGASERLRPCRAAPCLYIAVHQPGWSIARISRSENVLAHALARKARRSRDDVSVCLDTDVAEALMERAGMPELTSGHRRVGPRPTRHEHQPGPRRRAHQARHGRRDAAS